MKVLQLNWDSNFFDKKIGKLDIHNSGKFNPKLFIEQAQDEKYELIYINVYDDNILNQELVTKANIELMDIMITMSKANRYNVDNSYQLYSSLSEQELNDCYIIAEQIAIVSRFYKEDKIGPDKTKSLYRKWVDNAVNQSFSDGLLLEKDNDKVIGFHIVKSDNSTKSGICSLIGVDTKLKGKGVGTKLWDQANSYWSSKNNIEYCKVPFSLQNRESFNFHIKIGFNKVDETKYIYHYRNNKIK